MAGMEKRGWEVDLNLLMQNSESLIVVHLLSHSDFRLHSWVPCRQLNEKRQRARARAVVDVEKLDCSLDVEKAKGKDAEKEEVERPSLRILPSEGG